MKAKQTYFELILEWNSGHEDSYMDPEAFKKRLKKAVKTEGELEYLTRRREKLEKKTT